DEAKLLTLFLQTDSLPYINIKEVSDKITRAFAVRVKMHVHVINEYKLSLLYPHNLPVYFDNLIRVGLLETPNNLSLDGELYKELESCETVLGIKNSIESKGMIFETERLFIRSTSFGYQFI